MDLAKEAERLLASEWVPGSLIIDLLEAAGATEIEMEPWCPAPDLAAIGEKRAGTRAIKARLLVPKNPMAPKTSRVKTTYEIEVSGQEEETAISILQRLTFYDTPYCDCFDVLERIFLEPAQDGQGGVFVTKSFALDFHKRTMMQGAIQVNCRATQLKSGEWVCSYLQQRAAASSLPAQVTVVEAWELQRRVTLFHQTWQAPFLPHDGEKACKWVDEHFRPHPWASGKTLVSAALAQRPPLCPPGGWPENSVGWSIVDAPGGGCDKEGWQYGFDFYEDPAVWGQKAEFAHCRRRLWRCSVGESSQPPPAGGAEKEKLASRCESRDLSVTLVFTAFLIVLVVISFSGALFGYTSVSDVAGSASVASPVAGRGLEAWLGAGLSGLGLPTGF